MLNKIKYFGTDGIRGKIGSFCIHPEFILKLGWAIGQVISSKHENKNFAVIGKDTRQSCDMIESALESGLSASGLNIISLGLMPTPAIAYITNIFKANIGIVISASHNDFHDNGIKIFSSKGMKCNKEFEFHVECALKIPMHIQSKKKFGKIIKIHNISRKYIDFCKKMIFPIKNLQGIKIVIDCANGSTYKISPIIFEELGANVIVIGNKPNGMNINKNCGSTNLHTIKTSVINFKADIGISFDGDGDRVILIDELGNIINGDKILFIIVKYLQQMKLFSGGVVGTIMSNYGLEKAIKKLKIPFFRSDVGDKNIIQILKKNGWYIGGEPSGHIIDLSSMTTCDGIIIALKILKLMIEQQKTLKQLGKEIDLIPQIVINIKTRYAIWICNHINVQKYILFANHKLKKEQGRIILHPSGTESILRISIEGNNKNNIEIYAKQITIIINDLIKFYSKSEL